MKILYVDTVVDGHHLSYMKALYESSEYDQALLVSDKADKMTKKYYYYDKNMNQNPWQYMEWINLIVKCAKKENADIIHILNGDALYRCMGLLLWRLRKYKVIITFHHMHFHFLKKISIKHIFAHIYMGVVHTKALKNKLNDMGINNVTHIEYPFFGCVSNRSRDDIKKQYAIPDDCKVVLSIGSTRYDKGIDILLDACNKINKKFCLVIAGKEDNFTEKFIDEKLKNDNVKLIKIMRFLSDDELRDIYRVGDIVVLPYRKVFDGASGPLVEGAVNNLTIVGANHGSLGNIINENHLGYTFESENTESLANVLSTALESNFQYDEYAKKYKYSVDVDVFKKSYLNLYFDN